MAKLRKNKSDRTNLPTMRRPPTIPTGPRIFRPKKDRGYRGGPGEPPPGFLTGTTSKSEWWLYWAMFKALDIPADPRTPPFHGYANVFGYQVGNRQQGGSVADYIVYSPRKSYGQSMIFRLQTEYFHNYTDSQRQAYDLQQMWRLSQYGVVIDIYDWEFLEDPRGSAAVALLKRGLAGETYSPPGATGIARRVRPYRRVG